MFKDKGTVIRTILLVVALINQINVIYGKEKLPVDEATLNNIWDLLYVTGSTVFTLVMTIISWFKNNYVTKKGAAQKEVLEQHGLK